MSPLFTSATLIRRGHERIVTHVGNQSSRRGEVEIRSGGGRRGRNGGGLLGLEAPELLRGPHVGLAAGAGAHLLGRVHLLEEGARLGGLEVALAGGAAPLDDIHDAVLLGAGLVRAPAVLLLRRRGAGGGGDGGGRRGALLVERVVEVDREHRPALGRHALELLLQVELPTLRAGAEPVARFLVLRALLEELLDVLRRPARLDEQAVEDRQPRVLGHRVALHDEDRVALGVEAAARVDPVEVPREEHGGLRHGAPGDVAGLADRPQAPPVVAAHEPLHAAVHELRRDHDAAQVHRHELDRLGAVRAVDGGGRDQPVAGLEQGDALLDGAQHALAAAHPLVLVHRRGVADEDLVAVDHLTEVVEGLDAAHRGHDQRLLAVVVEGGVEPGNRLGGEAPARGVELPETRDVVRPLLQGPEIIEHVEVHRCVLVIRPTTHVVGLPLVGGLPDCLDRALRT